MQQQGAQQQGARQGLGSSGGSRKQQLGITPPTSRARGPGVSMLGKQERAPAVESHHHEALACDMQLCPAAAVLANWFWAL